MASNFGERHFESFSGADIRAVFGSREIGELQAISYAIQREKAPVYTLGHVNPRAFSRGKRGIAGSLVFILFDSAALINEMGIYAPATSEPPDFLSSRDEIRPQDGGPFGTTGVEPIPVTPGMIGYSPVEETGDIDLSQTYVLSKAWYSDQIPPFDVTIVAANEYGSGMNMRIIGVEIINEGYGISVDDMNSEQQMTYVARAIIPWRAGSKWHSEYTGGRWTVATGP